MRIVRTSTDGHLRKQETAYFGGTYSFWEKLTRKGIGSAKVLYNGGIPEFDLLDRGLPNELCFINFELLKNGLLVRLNQNQRLACVGTRLSDIEQITLEAFRIEIKRERFGILETKIIHRGELNIAVAGEEPACFSILSGQFSTLLSFFQRPEFQDKLVFTISTKPPEKDYGYLFEFINIGW